jgi:hypothetical protein
VRPLHVATLRSEMPKAVVTLVAVAGAQQDGGHQEPDE